MQGNIPVSLQLSDGIEIATSQTNGMGCLLNLELISSDIPGGTTCTSWSFAKWDNIHNITVKGMTASINHDTLTGVELTIQLAVFNGYHLNSGRHLILL